MSTPAGTVVFVYGTLKRGQSNHALLARQTFLGEARTGPGVTLYSLGEFPGMVRDPYDTAGVVGEIWSVDANCLARLDEFEGVPEGLYERVRIALLPPHQAIAAQAYLYALDVNGRPHIGSTWPV